MSRAMLRGIINGPVGSTSHEEGRRRSSFDWNGIPTIGTIGERGKFQTFTETRIFRHVKIHEHVRTWNRSFRGGKFPRKKEGGEGRRLNDTWPTKSCGGNAARRHLAPPQSFHPPLSKTRFSFSLPFLFFFFLIFPRSMDFLTRDRCKSWKSFPPSHDARGIFKSNLARYVYSQGRESDEFLFFFFIDARTDRISRTFAYIYGFIEAVQRIF